MYWCNIKGNRLTGCLAFFILLAATACTRPDVKETKGQLKYFDLKGFMHKDSAKLVLGNPTVNKTVNHNGDAETRSIKIANWGNELSLFTASDINKPSWRDSYYIITKGDSVIYHAKVPGLKTQKLVVGKLKGAVNSIHIFNHTKNMLYETSEDLFYIPGLLYAINKDQHVLLLGSNRYIIKGKILK